MKSETYACDICGKQKGDVNHWWMYDPPKGPQQCFGIWEWDNDCAAGLKHACGQECVIKAVNEWMQGQGSLSALPSQETK